MIDSYVVGIDLGTTNAVVAYTPVTQGKTLSQPTVLPIGQWVDQGVWQERLLFPTYRYHVMPHEKDILASLPFDFQPLPCDFPVIFGQYAVKLGALNRGQGVCSAKSWLSQASRVHHDASDAFLPWGSNREATNAVALVSPVVATASYLHYLHSWWNHCFPAHPLSEQTLVITLPASFDEYARDLTIVAAELAGLAHAQLLEEPTAAAYAWLNDQTQASISDAGVMCVLDIGGGTMDLSLIDFKDSAAPKRLAVGDHLMLGGDNLDAAIAQMALQQMQEQSEAKIHISSAQWAQLMLSARECKEMMMDEQAPDTVSLSVLGRGKSLIAQQKKAELCVQNVRQSLLNGFLPCISYDECDDGIEVKLGLVQMGLQFEQETAMTRHLLAFLKKNALPIDSVLFNGGFFNAEGFQLQIEQQLKVWSDTQWQGQSVHILKPSDPQLAVAMGAVLYGHIRATQGVESALIGGGSPRSLFLQLESAKELEPAQENVETVQRAQTVCVAIKGMDEGQPVVLDHEFNLMLNRPVQFTLYSTTSAFPLNVKVGDIVPVQPDWIQLPPMQVSIYSNDMTTGQQAAGQDMLTVSVQLVSEISMIGSLQLQLRSGSTCVPDTLLEFAGRSGVVGARMNKHNLPHDWDSVVALIEAVYGPRQKQGQFSSSDKEVMVALRKRIEQVLGPKNTWDVTICRSLADVLLQWQKNRRRSARHEAFWLSTLGFAMRPGYGVVGDFNRMEHLKSIVKSIPAYHDHNVWFAWWTLVRRIAPGLGAATQEFIFQTQEQKIKSVIDTLALKSRFGGDRKKIKEKKGVKKTQPVLSKKEQDLKNRAPEALLRAISSFDTLRGKTWFEPALFALLHADGVGVSTPLGVNKQVLAWCFGQVAGRYGSTGADEFNPLPIALLEKEVNHWLLEDWVSCPELGLAASIAAQRATDDIQISNVLYEQVEQKLIQSRLPQAWLDFMKARDQKDAFQETLSGERLPQGLGL